MATRPSLPVTTSIRFGPADARTDLPLEFELDVDRLELRHHGQPVSLRPQAIQALSLLLQHDGRVVSIEELRTTLWGNQHLQWRNSLHQCLRDLRKALSDDARNPRFVASVARVGYRFVGVPRSPATASRMERDRRSWLGRALRKPPVAFATGFSVAVLVPIALLALCAMLGG